MKRSALAWLLALVVLGGCGGSSGDKNAEKAITVPAYGPFPATTVPVSPGTPALCRAKAKTFTRAAASFLLPFPSDADNYRVLARLQYSAFKAHHCDTAILRRTFSRRLTLKQRRVVVSYFGFLGELGEELAQPTQN
jgi:hypothetical protein